VGFLPALDGRVDPALAVHVILDDLSAHKSPLPALLDAVYAYVNAHNEKGKSFTWTKTADEILAKVKRCEQRTVQVHGGPR
jgi:hypothetical protein